MGFMDTITNLFNEAAKTVQDESNKPTSAGFNVQKTVQDNPYSSSSKFTKGVQDTFKDQTAFNNALQNFAEKYGTPDEQSLNGLGQTDPEEQPQENSEQQDQGINWESVFSSGMSGLGNDYQGPTQKTGVDKFYEQSGLAPEKYETTEEAQAAKQEETLAEDWTEAHKQVLKNHGWGDISPQDWTANATADQFFEYVNDPLMRPFYSNVRGRFADGADEFSREQFDSYWNYFKPYDWDHWINGDETMLAYGTDADYNRAIVQDLMSNYGYNTENLGFGTIDDSSDESSRKLAEALALYSLLDKSAQQAIASGQVGDDYVQYFTDYDLGQFGEADNLGFTLSDLEGAKTMEELGKTENWQHDSNATDKDTFEEYGVAFTGLPDALNKASAGKIKAYEKAQEQQLLNQLALLQKEGK